MVETGTIETDGSSIFFRMDADSANAPWLVFCNSLLTDMTVWDGQVSAFRDRFSILRYDQRGHGRSSDPGRALDFDALGSDVIMVMDRCGVSSATLVGLSMGTPTALDVWSKRPDLIERLVLCDGQAHPTPDGIALWDQRVEEARTLGLDAYCASTMNRWFGAGFLQSEPERTSAFLSMMRATRFPGFEYCVRALQDFDYSDQLAGIDVPTQIIVGGSDGGLPAVMRKIQQAIPRCALSEIADAGHIPNFEKTVDFNRVLAEFLDVQ